MATTLDDIAKQLKDMNAEIATIKRGIYGDEPNNVKGLIQTDHDQEKRIKSLEETRKRFMWTGTGVMLAFQAFIEWIKLKAL